MEETLWKGSHGKERRPPAKSPMRESLKMDPPALQMAAALAKHLTTTSRETRSQRLVPDPQEL